MADVSSHELVTLPVENGGPAWSDGWRFHLLLLAGAVVLGLTLELAGPSWAQRIFERVQLNTGSGLAALLAALAASTIAHELGHLCAAWFLNFDVLSIALGPFRLEWGHGKTRMHVVPHQWARCSISAAPREVRNCWRARMLMVVAAGPLTSLCFLLVAVAALPNAFGSCCAEVNFFLVVLGLAPNGRFAKARNDAALFWALWTYDADAQDMRLCHEAIDAGARGATRPSLYPKPLLEALANHQGRPYTRYVAARRMCEWAIDSNDLQTAKEWDERALRTSADCSEHIKNQAKAESACFDAIFRNDHRSAVHKFSAVRFEDLAPNGMAARCEAARVIACGAPHLALKHILRARGYRQQGSAFEAILLDNLERKTGHFLPVKH